MTNSKLPPKQASTLEIIQFVRSLLGISKYTIEKIYANKKFVNYFSRQHMFNLSIGQIILIYNIFDICDICIIEFGNLQDSAKCYELCNNTLHCIGTHLWFDNNTLIHFYINRSGKRSFRFCLEPLRSAEALVM